MNWKRTLALASCVTLAVLLGGVLGLGQTDPADETALAEPIQRCGTFLAALSNNVEDAYAALLKDSPLREKGTKVAADTKKLFAMDAPYGKPRKEAAERVKTQLVGTDLGLLRYVQKFDNLPVVWYFTFYRTGGRWVLVTVRFDHEYELAGL